MLPIEILKPTKKFSPRLVGIPIKRIVMHDTDGSFPGCLTWLTEPPPLGSEKSSCHVIVTKNGDIMRLVGDDQMAWHCRGYNADSLGIELERAKNDETSGWGETQLEAAAFWIGKKCKEYNIALNHIFPHFILDPARRRDPRNFPWHSFMLRVAEIVLDGDLNL